ncbi:MAG: NAD(P)/FAD-dependent oxidoreductase [Desulfotalea sp.]
MKEFDIIIIGGGAAGLLAAGAAAESGASVALFEKMKQTGRKIGISGKGRCNVTNSAELADFIGHFGKNGKFLRQAFGRFFSDDLLKLLSHNGMQVTLERGGRYFPKSGKALEVVRTLDRWLKKLDVTVYQHQAINHILQEDGKIIGVQASNTKYSCKKVVIATGGKSYPRTGSTGDGYRFLKELGHTIEPLHPALVPLTSAEGITEKLEGLELKNIEACLLVNKKKKATYFGEISFLDGHINGPCGISMSGQAVQALKNGDEVAVSIDLKPALDSTKLDARVIRDLTEQHTKNIAVVMRGLLPRQLISPFLAHCQLAARTSAGTFPAVMRKKLVHNLKNFTIQIDGHRDYDEAIVTAGGLNLKEVIPKTMESRKISGLYVAGELLDLDGDTGGFNLQAAFSTGWLAGTSAAESLNKAKIK